MKVTLNENLEKCELILSVSLPLRKRVSDTRIKFKSSDAEKYVSENYTPSKGYTLGVCKTKNKVADNDTPLQNNMEWVFCLDKQVVKKQTRKKPVLKKQEE